ncbi:MAG: hypothetical protein FJ090_04350 [Deltaproteobacteria bacterium]|nr:hypothetical protein [Deltaproteobacteria bacterium]
MIWLLACAEPAPELVANPERVTDCTGLDPQLRALCHVQVAAARGRAADFAAVTGACALYDGRVDDFDELWADECHFRGGEELARAGQLEDGLRHCNQAGRFRKFCFAHAAWQVPPTAEPLADWEAWATPFGEREVETIRARWWFNQYFGTGTAAAPKVDSPHARGAWALEAVRLCAGDLDCARAGWTRALSGDPLPPERRLGRYDLPFEVPGDEDVPTVPTFGGGQRYAGTDLAEDIDIALLEGAYFRESVGAGAFVPYLPDPRPRVRWTALHRYRTLPSEGAEGTLRTMVDDPDPVVRALASDALQYRTWEGKKNLPGLKKERPAP